MFNPLFSITFHLNFNLEEIERARYRVERTLIMPKHEQWLRREAFIRTAYSSTMVEDGTISEDELGEMARPSPAATIPKERPEIINYGRALEFVDFLSDMSETWEPTPMEATIRQIHWLLMHTINDPKIKPGQYRREPNWIIDQGIRVYEPPSSIDVPLLMRDFSLWLQKEEKDLPPIIKAGVAHAHLVAIHPFVDGNGRTARLLATLLLQQSGFRFRKLFSLDAYYQRHRNEYIDALRESIGERYHEGYDSTAWLQFFTESVLIQAKNLEEKLTDWKIMVDKVHKSWKRFGLNDRQIDGLIYAVNRKYLTRKDYTEITGISSVTASRDLAKLVEKGLLRPEGTGRNRRYIPVNITSK